MTKTKTENNGILIDVSTRYILTSKVKVLDKKYVFFNVEAHLRNNAKESWFNDLFVKLKNENINYIIVGQGPGSFTSLRICYAYLRTTGVMTGIKIANISSLFLWYKALSLKQQTLCIPLNQANVYIYKSDNNSYDLVKVQELKSLENKKKEKLIILDNLENNNNILSSLQLNMISATQVNDFELTQQEVNFKGWQEALPDYGLALNYNKNL